LISGASAGFGRLHRRHAHRMVGSDAFELMTASAMCQFLIDWAPRLAHFRAEIISRICDSTI
jgi:hypothetical protein